MKTLIQTLFFLTAPPLTSVAQTVDDNEDDDNIDNEDEDEDDDGCGRILGFSYPVSMTVKLFL